MAATFEVIAQAPTSAVNNEGRVVAATQVTFKTKPSGQTGRVVITDDMYSTDEVARVVGERAAIIEGVQVL